MPGKELRYKSTPLTRKQSKIATNILLKYFNPNLGEGQLDYKHNDLVKEVNNMFIDIGYQPIYIKRKLSDWVSNRLYRLRKTNRCNRVIQKPVNRVIQKPVHRVITVAEEFHILNEAMFNYLPILYDIE